MESEPETQLPEGKNIVAMGQLIWQKGFDLLLDVFARVSKTDKNWNLIIAGTGIMRDELHQQVKKLGLEDSVFFLGHVRNPFAIFAKCDIFVLSSRYEGFPNVLLEAMVCGLPPVSFDCPSGPGEIIQQGINGFLVPPEDIKSMGNTLYELMKDEELRVDIGKEASKVRGRYTPDKIMKQWDKLIN
jgi:glycosyltransferase involved in cell wall biosynthesis